MARRRKETFVPPSPTDGVGLGGRGRGERKEKG